MSSRARSFPLKNGYCYIFPDHILIERQDFAGKVLHLLEKYGLRRSWVLYLAFTIVLVLSALLSVIIENYFLAAFFAAFAFASLIAIWVTRKQSFAATILREQITSVEFKEAVQGVSRATFTFYFRPGRATLKRTVFLPSFAKGDAQVVQAAYMMMKEEKLIE